METIRMLTDEELSDLGWETEIVDIEDDDEEQEN